MIKIMILMDKLIVKAQKLNCNSKNYSGKYHMMKMQKL